jgi:hypothetical protein
MSTDGYVRVHEADMAGMSASGMRIIAARERGEERKPGQSPRMLRSTRMQPSATEE